MQKKKCVPNYNINVVYILINKYLLLNDFIIDKKKNYKYTIRIKIKH